MVTKRENRWGERNYGFRISKYILNNKVLLYSTGNWLAKKFIQIFV